MKKIFMLIVAVLSAAGALAQENERIMVVLKTDGTAIRVSVGEVREVFFENDTPEPEPTMESVDLGLSVKWATCNLGADKPESYGDYYGWGCPEPYAKGDDAGWPLYFQKIGGSGTDESDCGTEKDPLQEYVYHNNKSIAGTKWDAARKKLGGKWRMPTQDEFNELLNNCTCSWTTLNGVNGYKVVSKKDTSKYIFLPAAGGRYGISLLSAGLDGYYWGATPNSSNAYYACSLYFYSGSRRVGRSSRFVGFPVRPVTE